VDVGACRIGRADGGTDSTRQTSARRPTATGPSQTHASCGAWQATGESDAPANRAEWPRRRSHDRPTHSEDDTVVARVYRGVEESHLPTPGLRANRSGWLPSSERRGALRAHRRSGGACFRVWPGRSDLARSGRRRTQRGRNNCPPPPTANRSDHFEPASRATRSAPDRRCRPFCQSRKRHQHVIPDPHASSCGSICHGMPLRRTKTMPVRHARSDTRGRPPFGRGGELGRSGSTRSHNASGSSAAARPAHVTAHRQVDALTVSAAEVLLCALSTLRAARDSGHGPPSIMSAPH
jgi:hypothetical protein